jgi:hypothetical protein
MVENKESTVTVLEKKSKFVDGYLGTCLTGCQLNPYKTIVGVTGCYHGCKVTEDIMEEALEKGYIDRCWNPEISRFKVSKESKDVVKLTAEFKQVV